MNFLTLWYKITLEILRVLRNCGLVYEFDLKNAAITAKMGYNQN